ncbi:hypothetical protein BGLA2_700107 [Burkholderia gladioli]|nr:hypothetical protein BGLA2_700107 [Burkholderia gladioli]
MRNEARVLAAHTTDHGRRSADLSTFHFSSADVAGVFLQFVIREPHERAVTLVARDGRPRAALFIDRYAAGLPTLRIAQLVHPPLDLAQKKHDVTLAEKRFLLAIATRIVSHSLGIHRCVFLCLVYVELRFRVRSIATPNFYAVAAEKSPTVFHGHPRFRKHQAMSIRGGRNDVALATHSPIFPVGERRCLHDAAFLFVIAQLAELPFPLAPLARTAALIFAGPAASTSMMAAARAASGCGSAT